MSVSRMALLSHSDIFRSLLYGRPFFRKSFQTRARWTSVPVVYIVQTSKEQVQDVPAAFLPWNSQFYEITFLCMESTTGGFLLMHSSHGGCSSSVGLQASADLHACPPINALVPLGSWSLPCLILSLQDLQHVQQLQTRTTINLVLECPLHYGNK